MLSTTHFSWTQKIKTKSSYLMQPIHTLKLLKLVTTKFNLRNKGSLTTPIQQAFLTTIELCVNLMKDSTRFIQRKALMKSLDLLLLVDQLVTWLLMWLLLCITTLVLRKWVNVFIHTQLMQKPSGRWLMISTEKL